MKDKRVLSIVGIVGVPASYGGFETMVENLLDYLPKYSIEATVFCSSHMKSKVLGRRYKSALLRYLPFKANGFQSILYDIVSLLISATRGGTVLLLGVSGSIILPFIRVFFPHVRIITNIDGIEWRRGKWNLFAKAYLFFSESIAVFFSNKVVADNIGVCEYIRETYGRGSAIIAYGGDHVLSVEPHEDLVNCYQFSSSKYFLNVSRVEPENNTELIIRSFCLSSNVLVMVGNWDTEYGRSLKLKYGETANIHLVDATYDLRYLNFLRRYCFAYIHGHSAGGTNPSLVEAMFFGKAILAYDVNFNRFTTKGKAKYFSTSAELGDIIASLTAEESLRSGAILSAIAMTEYRWSFVASEYAGLVLF